ncbi:MAG: hypothetical protein HQ495_09715 [Alphaproteobacteria bacterium]|nr:hypothetical protein [Alphaproteobacteria bacterium]
MKSPEWLKPAIFGGVVGAIALAIIGFAWGGWVTGGSSERIAANHAEMEVVAALLPICIQLSEQDPQVVDTLAKLKSAGRFQRGDLLMEAGWATIPGTTEPNRAVANACVDHLSAQF